MTDDEACQKHIDAKIPRELQECYAQLVSCYKSGWKAALRWVKENDCKNVNQ